MEIGNELGIVHILDFGDSGGKMQTKQYNGVTYVWTRTGDELFNIIMFDEFITGIHSHELSRLYLVFGQTLYQSFSSFLLPSAMECRSHHKYIRGKC